MKELEDFVRWVSVLEEATDPRRQLAEIAKEAKRLLRRREEMKRDVKDAYAKGDWVTELGGLRRTGQVADYRQPFRFRLYTIQFGADGPFQEMSPDKFRPATKDEIAEKEGR